jgi:manganese/zinc/iron transport system permease protein
MSSGGLVILIAGVLVASACAMLGSFLVLRKMAMMSDAISHAILPGLVVGYFFAHGPNLLFGFVGAAAAAIITVTAVEALQNTRRVGGESAIGIVFPAMFALGTFLVSKFFADVHLDTDAVLYGNIEFAPLDLFLLGGVNLGPQSFWVLGGLCILNLLFITLFYKELKLATFDAGLAATLGFSPMLIHYALMAMVSITSVGAFTVVGAILVVALVIVPAATAYLLTDKLPRMILYSVLVGAASAVSGYFVAVALDASVAGAMATMTGVFFAAAVLFSPLHGVIAKSRRLERQRVHFAVRTLLVHLFTHERQIGKEHEAEVVHLSNELRWTPELAQRVVASASGEGLVQRSNGHLELTGQGRDTAAALVRAQ